MENHLFGILVWLSLGVVTGLASIILPFQFGPRGIVTSLGVAIGGALAGGTIGYLLGLYSRLTSPLALTCVSLSALGISLIVHTISHYRQTLIARRNLPFHHRP